MSLPKVVVSVVIMEFKDFNDCSLATTELTREGVKNHYVGNNRIESRIDYDPRDFVRILRMGQRDLRWKEAEESKGGGGYDESINPGV